MQSFKHFIEAKSSTITSERDARKILKFPTSTMDFVSLTQYKGYYLVAEEDLDDDRSQMYYQVFDKSKKLVKVKIKNASEFKAFVDKAMRGVKESNDYRVGPAERNRRSAASSSAWAQDVKDARAANKKKASARETAEDKYIKKQSKVDQETSPLTHKSLSKLKAGSILLLTDNAALDTKYGKWELSKTDFDSSKTKFKVGKSFTVVEVNSGRDGTYHLYLKGMPKYKSISIDSQFNFANFPLRIKQF